MDYTRQFNTTAIGLRPAVHGTGDTRFGGHPNLAAGIRWPLDKAGRPMHHLVQVDCAALPQVDPDMPRTGTLMFFVAASYEEDDAPSLGEDGSDAFAIIYQDVAPSDTPLRPHPPNCPALGESSYAINPVVLEPTKQKMGFFQRLVNTQPKAYSGRHGTGYFEAVPFEVVKFNSAPTVDPQTMFDVFDARDYQYAKDSGLRPTQMLGYAPVRKDLIAAMAEGFRTCSEEKALSAMGKAKERDDVLLLQLTHEERLNFDLVSSKFALQFRISRSALQARAFDLAVHSFEEIGMDGLWSEPEPKPERYAPQPSEMLPQIGLKPLTPLEAPSVAANYFCGNPRMPQSMEWPCLDNGEPMSFLMQVDCASLPREVLLGQDTLMLPEFPKSGTMFLFAYAYMDEASSQSIRILYTSEDTTNLPERTPPAALKVAQDDYFQSIWQNAQSGEAVRAEPKRPFEPIGFANIAPPLAGDPQFDEKCYCAERFNGAFPHEENAFPGVNLVIGWLPNFIAQHFSKDCRFDISSISNPIRYVPQSYPWRWGDIASATKSLPAAGSSKGKDKSQDTLFDEVLIAEGNAWKELAQTYDALDRISDDHSQAYREWLMHMDACGAKLREEQPNESAADRRSRYDLWYNFRDVMRPLAKLNQYGETPTTLQYLAFDQAADDIPVEMREAVASVVKFNRSDTQLSGYNTMHRPNPDLMFTNANKGQDSDSEVLLFSLASGSGLPVNWADHCWLDIWIEAEDLAKARFDRIRPTIRF